MFYVDIGLLEGADRPFGSFLLHNLLPVTLGNFVGGGVFLGLAQVRIMMQESLAPFLFCVVTPRF
jgi:formate/nitrite transporter FocA (FNT family)